MAGNSRDVTLTLSVDTLGKEGVDQLKQALAALAKEGGAASPEFQKLADEIDRLGQQTQAVQSFRQLAVATEELRTKQADVSATALQIKERLDAVRLATEAARDKQREATQALNEGQVAYIEAGTALRVLKAGYDAAGKKAAQYRPELQTLTQEQGRLNAELVRLRQAQSEATAATTVAEAAQRKLEGQYQRSEAQVQRTTGALAAQEAALSTAAEAARALGLTTDDMAEAETRLLRSFEQTETAIQAHTAALTAAKAVAADDQWQREAFAAVEAAEAAQRLARETEVLAATQRELAAQRAFEKQAQGAQKLREAAQYVREFEQALQEAEQQQRAMAAASAEEQWRQEAFAIVEAAEAAQRLARETEVLAATQRELAAQRAFEKQAQEAQKLREAAQYVRELEAAIEAVERPAREAAAAFQTLGRQSVQDLERQIVEVRTAMERVAETSRATGTSLTGAFAAGEAKIAALQREIRELTGTLTTADKASALFKNSLGQITAGNLVADGIGYLVGKVKELGREFVQAIVQGDKMRLAMNSIYKDSGLAASQIQFLKDSANAAGVSYGDLSKDFIRFSASMKSANIPLQQANELFAALTRAGGSLGMSAEETSGALNALGQMASKGVVSMEELRQQLGDRLPGAFGLVAKGLGITEAALVDLVSSGSLAARDLFPALTGALKTMHGETNGLSGAWERLKNVFKGFSQDMGDSGWATLLTFAIKGLGIAVSAVLMPLQILWELIRNITVSVAAFWAAVQGDFAGAMEIMRTSLGESNKRLTDSSARIAEMVNGQGKAAQATDGASAAIQGNTTALGANAAATGAAAVQLGTLAQAAVQSASGMTGLERVTQLQALAMNLAADATKNASQQKIQFTEAAERMLDMQKADTDAAAKNAKAMQDSGAALVSLIALRGDEQATLAATATAAANYKVEIDKVNASQQAELQILELQLAARVKEQATRPLTAEQIKQENAELETKLVTARAEAAQSAASAEAARQEALARQLASEAYADNSAKVGEYAEALEKARAELAALQAHHERGTVTAAQVNEGQENLTRAQSRYNDALADSVTKLQAYGDAQRAVHTLITAGLTLELKQAEAAERIARLLGKETEARDAARKQREIEIKLAEAKVKALQDEADAMEKLARAQEQDLLAKGRMTEIDQVRISNSLRAAEAKRQEAQAVEAGIPAMQKEAELLGKSTEAYVKKAEAIQRKTAVMKAESELLVSGLELRKSELDASIKIAEANGDEAQAIKLKIEQKRIEIQIIQETVKAQIAEAQASADTARAKMSELQSTGNLTAKKREELEAQIKAAEAKINEAKARGQGVRVLEAEIDALRKSSAGYDKNASSINQTTAALEKMNAAREKEIAAQEKKIQLDEREQELYRKKWQVDKEGYSVDANGDRIAAINETQQSLYNKGKDAGLTATQAKELADRLAPGPNEQFFEYGEFWKEVNRLKQLNDLAEEELKNKPAPPAPAPAPRPEPAPARAPNAPEPAPARTPGAPVPEAARGATPPPTGGAISGSKTINLQINGGQTTPVNVVSETDAQALNSFMRRVESAKGVAL